MNLAINKCVPCEGQSSALTYDQAAQLLNDVPSWKMNTNKDVILREFQMKNFTAAIQFINKVAEVAESENHHPDIHLSGYRNLRIELSTHAIKGLSKNDFILAAKINQLPVELKV